MDKYIKRYVDAEIEKNLKAIGAILIEGPKWCGKTSSAENQCKSAIYFSDPDEIDRYFDIYNNKMSILLEGENPRLIDEWQIMPKLWDATKFQIDRRKENGLFLLTGSSLPIMPKTAHSGAGRFAIIKMFPMSLYESGESNGDISLSSDLLANKESIDSHNLISLEDLIFIITRGGWPALIDKDLETIQLHIKNYLNIITNREVNIVDNVNKDPNKMYHLLLSLARNNGTLASNTTILSDVNSFDNVSERTIYSYISALKQIFIINDIPAWGPMLRSRAILRKKPKRYIIDPSLVVSLLGANEYSLLRDFSILGQLFKSLVIRDLQIYCNEINARVYHYRDSNDMEVDAIIRFSDLRWAAIEIKLSDKRIDEAVNSLLKFKNNIDTDKMDEPVFMLVITSSGVAYRHESGIYIVPIGCLRD